MMTILSRSSVAIAMLAVGANPPIAAQVVPLKPVSSFSTIRDERARSVALFVEAAKSDHESALHELSSGNPSADAGR